MSNAELLSSSALPMIHRRHNRVPVNKQSRTGKLLLRADAGVRTGTGHVMRCLALAQAWRAHGGDAAFLSHAMPSSLAARLKSEQFEMIELHSESGSLDDANQTAVHAAQQQASWVICDGYVFDAHFQRLVQQFGTPLMIVDDYGSLDGYHCTAVLNQNPRPPENWYEERDDSTKLMLGTSFALLRREFADDAQERTHVRALGQRVLVTLGGSDPDNVSSLVLKALSQIKVPDLEVRIIVGGANPHLRQLIAQAKESPIAAEILADRRDMPELMKWADLVISAGGSTCWELACLGVPHLVVILADNQERIAHQLDGETGLVNLGWFHQLNSESLTLKIDHVLRRSDLREELACRGRKMVDGYGATRVVTYLQDHALKVQQRSQS